MDLETFVTKLEDRLDSQHKSLNAKLDKFLDEMHKQDKKIQKLRSDLGLLTKINITLGTTALGLFVWLLKGG